MEPVPVPADALDVEATCDVIVVGSGAGGLSAALTARLGGLDVVLLEKAEVLGGTTAISGGGIWIPCNPIAGRLGLHDSHEAALAYFQHMTGNRFDADRVKAFLDAGPKMVEFFEANTALKFTVAADRPDYRPGAPGATEGGRTIFPLPFDGRELGHHLSKLRPPAAELTFLGMMIRPGPELKQFLTVFRSAKAFRYVSRRLFRHVRDVVLHGRSMDLSNGNALVARMLKSAIDLGVSVEVGAGVEGLILEDGRVQGVSFRDASGLRTLRARRGVVLASGGFPQGEALKQRFYPHARGEDSLPSPAPATNTGDGLRMAEQAGARINGELSNPAAWVPVSLVPKKTGKPTAFPHLIDRQKPGFIAVLSNGRRFVNEADSYHDFGRALVAACAEMEETCCYLVADHRAVRKYGIGFAKPAPIPLQPHLRSGYLTRSDTLNGLAESLGIAADRFVQTVNAFNQTARQGTDPEFGRGSTSYNRYNGDGAHAPNPCIAPLEDAPFYAVKVMLGELGTFTGIRTDAKARALNADGDIIQGLFAVGNDMSHVMSGEYMGGGSTLGPAMTFGYVAGRLLADGDTPS